MADLLSIAVSGLEAFTQALTVTSNNISNASTPGYTREQIQLSPSLAQNFGAGFVGSGVDVTGVTRIVDQFAQSQAQSANQALAQQNAFVDIANQVDSTLGNSSNGISAALSSFFGAFQTLSTNPSSPSLRSNALTQAQSLAQAISQTASQLTATGSTISGQIAVNVGQVNTLTANIAALNSQISQISGSNPNQAPNSLLDQRDQLVSQLSQLVGVRTNTEANGAIDVYVGTGQALVVGSQSTALSTTTNVYQPGQLDVVYGTGSTTQVISNQLTGGTLSGLVQAQAQIVTPALNALGQIATAVGVSVNAAQAQGATASNTFGGNLFTVPAPTVGAAASNADVGSYGVIQGAVTNVGALGTDNYVLSYSASGGWSAVDAQTGAPVAVAQPNATTLQIPAPSPAGTQPALTLTLPTATPPASGDTFLVQPTAAAALGLGVALTDPAGIAAGGLAPATAGSGNAGSAALSGLTGATPGAALPAAATTITFTSPTSYTVTIGSGPASAPIAYTSGGPITANGLKFTISGTPATGDSFAIPAQTGAGTGSDNRNAVAIAGLQTTGLLSGGTTSITNGFAALVGTIGTQTQAAITAQTAQKAVATQATQSLQAVSGVNLDEEGAKLVQWQQAYSAVGKVVSVAESLFQTLLSDLQH